MSSADATVDTVALATTVRGHATTWGVTALTALAVTQLVWLAALAYGVISLLR